MYPIETILIDVEEQKVKKVTLKCFSDIYKYLKCDTFCIGLMFENNTALYVDDNGYLKKGPKKFFKLKSFEPMQWLAGNGLFVREDEDGDMLGVSYTVEEIEKDVKFMQCDDEESCPKLPPPEIISF